MKAKKRLTNLEFHKKILKFEKYIYNVEEKVDEIFHQNKLLLEMIRNEVGLINERLTANQIGIDNVYKEFQIIKINYSNSNKIENIIEKYDDEN